MECKRGMKNLREILFLMLSYNGGPKVKVTKGGSYLLLAYKDRPKGEGNYLIKNMH